MKAAKQHPGRLSSTPGCHPRLASTLCARAALLDPPPPPLPVCLQARKGHTLAGLSSRLVPHGLSVPLATPDPRDTRLTLQSLFDLVHVTGADNMCVRGETI